MDDNTNPNVPGQGQVPTAGVPDQQPEPAQPVVEEPQVPSEPVVPQPEANVPGQTTPEPTVGA